MFSAYDKPSPACPVSPSVAFGDAEEPDAPDLPLEATARRPSRQTADTPAARWRREYPAHILQIEEDLLGACPGRRAGSQPGGNFRMRTRIKLDGGLGAFPSDGKRLGIGAKHLNCCSSRSRHRRDRSG